MPRAAHPTHPKAGGGQARLLELEGLDCCDPRAIRDPDGARRRLMTLVAVPTDAPKRGGSGRATKAFDAFGEPYCLKSLVLPDVQGIGRGRAEAVYRSRAAAFREEYLAQRMVDGIDGFPATFGYGLYAGGPVILMEWVEGRTLHAIEPLLPRDPAREGGVASEWVGSIGLRVLQILGAASVRDASFAHRDLSPSNVMVRLDRAPLRTQLERGALDIVLIDLGSASCLATTERVVAADGMEPDASGTFTLQTGIWRGATVEYAAPEMLTREAANIQELRASPKVDVYALCSLLYELYAGHTPYQLSAHPSLDPYRAKRDFAPVRLAPAEASDAGLVSAILSGLAGSQDARPDAGELAGRLAGWLSSRAPRMADALVASAPRARFAPPGRDLRLVPTPHESGSLRGAEGQLPGWLERRMDVRSHGPLPILRG